MYRDDWFCFDVLRNLRARRPETLHQVRKLIIKRRPLPLTAAAAVYRNEEAAAAGVLAALVSFLYFVSHTWVAFGWPPLTSARRSFFTRTEHGCTFVAESRRGGGPLRQGDRGQVCLHR